MQSKRQKQKLLNITDTLFHYFVATCLDMLMKSLGHEALNILYKWPSSAYLVTSSNHWDALLLTVKVKGMRITSPKSKVLVLGWKRVGVPTPGQRGVATPNGEVQDSQVS